jgi:hypothetical protein
MMGRWRLDVGLEFLSAFNYLFFSLRERVVLAVVPGSVPLQ